MGSHYDDGNNGGRRLRETRWCAVTGGRGFMARHLVAALLRSGEWRVRVTDLTPTLVLGPGETEEIFGDALRDGRAVYASADVCNIEQLIKAFQGVDVVFHTATADPSKNNLQLHYKVNVEGTKNVIDACKMCKVKRLIYTSSSAVVFDGIHGLFDVNESLPYPDKMIHKMRKLPLFDGEFPDAYAQTKAEAEKLVIKANGTNNLLTCCLRPGSIFGPGDTLISYLDRYGWTNLTIGDGKNHDDFVYVENVVHGHLCANKALSTIEGARTSGGKAYFITNMEPMNMWDFGYLVQEVLGYKRISKIRIPTIVIKPASYLIEWAYRVVFSHFGIGQPLMLTPARIKYITLNRTFSCNKAVEELGYKPIVTLQDGLRKTVKFYIHSRNKDLSKRY